MSRRANSNPGTSGSQKENARRSSVLATAPSRDTPSKTSNAADAASKLPRLPGKSEIVPAIEAITSAASAKSGLMDKPTACSVAQSVAPSRRKIVA